MKKFIWAFAVSFVLVDGSTETLILAPEQGLKLTKTFREELEWDLDSVEQQMDGEEILTGLEQEMSMSVESEIVLVDTFVKVDDERIRELEREIRSASSRLDLYFSAGVGEQHYVMEAGSEVGGLSGSFAWDEDEERYVPDFGDSSSDVIEKLAFEADLQCVLPEVEVSEGDGWTLSGDALARLFAPGGDLELRPIGPPEGEFDFLEIEDVLVAAFSSMGTAAASGTASGEGLARWTETLEESARKLARIEIDFELELDASFGKDVRELFETYAPDSTRQDSELDIEWSVTGKADVLWDLDAGHFHSVEVTSEGNADVYVSWTMAFGETASEFDMLARCTASSEFHGLAEE